MENYATDELTECARERFNTVVYNADGDSRRSRVNLAVGKTAVFESRSRGDSSSLALTSKHSFSRWYAIARFTDKRRGWSWTGVGAVGCTADCRRVVGEKGGKGEVGRVLRFAVMTAVLREAGLNQYPLISNELAIR